MTRGEIEEAEEALDRVAGAMDARALGSTTESRQEIRRVLRWALEALDSLEDVWAYAHFSYGCWGPRMRNVRRLIREGDQA